MNNELVVWTACLGCGKRVTGDSIHACTPQLNTLTDEQIKEVWMSKPANTSEGVIDFARAILRKAQEQ
jgi:hypothetical protein